MNINNIRDYWPMPDVTMGTITLDDGTKLQTLQHLPTPDGVYNLLPHVIKNGPLAGLRTYVMVNNDLAVFETPQEAWAYTGPLKPRCEILFHPGNWPQDSIGCILPGAARNVLYPLPSVNNSDASFKYLRGILDSAGGSNTWTITDLTAVADESDA